MSDTETRLREALHRVADTTEVTGRAEEIVGRPRRLLTGASAAVVGFLAVGLAIGVPMLVGSLSTETPDIGAPAAPTGNVAPPEFTLDPSWFVVDTSDLAWFDEMTAFQATGRDLPLEWRQSLRTEQVWCLHTGGPGSDTRASSFPIEADLTVSDLEYTCGVDNDSVRGLESPPATMTVCRGVHEDAFYDEWKASGEVSFADREKGWNAPGFMVVLGWEADCATAQLNTSPDVPVLSADLDLDKINQARRMEISITGASYSNCFTYDQAVAVADEARRRLGQGWIRAELSLPVDPGLCYQPLFEPPFGAILVMGRQYEELGVPSLQPRDTIEDSTGSTLAPDEDGTG